jgi:hypothetical protein
MEKYPATPEHPLSKEELTASIVGMEDNYYIPDARTFASAA